MRITNWRGRGYACPGNSCGTTCFKFIANKSYNLGAYRVESVITGSDFRG